MVTRGLNPDEGGAEMIPHETKSGAVFSVGSITWPSCVLVDKHVSKITSNVLETFLAKKK